MTFVLSDLVLDEATAAFAAHERRIRERLPDVEIRHTGGTSIRGVLTTGDVDIHVRTGREAFERAREVLAELYEPLHLDAWHTGGAFFAAPEAQRQVEVALTLIGTLDDLHHGEAWERIASDQRLLERYNALKREHEGGDRPAYDAAKREFFQTNFPCG